MTVTLMTQHRVYTTTLPFDELDERFEQGRLIPVHDDDGRMAWVNPAVVGVVRVEADDA